MPLSRVQGKHYLHFYAMLCAGLINSRHKRTASVMKRLMKLCAEGTWVICEHLIY